MVSSDLVLPFIETSVYLAQDKIADCALLTLGRPEQKSSFALHPSRGRRGHGKLKRRIHVVAIIRSRVCNEPGMSRVATLRHAQDGRTSLWRAWSHGRLSSKGINRSASRMKAAPLVKGSLGIRYVASCVVYDCKWSA
jgi:hypothetical protein